ncbi:MAG: helix-turn-helix transcriptional regulator [Stenotrophomonas sp.]|uniref:helix-turn-helix transcriptional regulator n=1 Tax=Stenotrophomonas sp. TaxID=69392 RepID=UPI003D6C9F39
MLHVSPISRRSRSTHCARAYLISGPPTAEKDDGNISLIRQAMSSEQRLRFRYRSQQKTMVRVVWPIAIGFLKGANQMAAQCELRKDFKHFRINRIECTEITEQCFGRSRRQLLKDCDVSIRHIAP